MVINVETSNIIFKPISSVSLLNKLNYSKFLYIWWEFLVDICDFF